jgi:hypothetical protein
MRGNRSAAARQQSLFDPKTGAFAGNIRDIGGDDSELRESLKEFGWVTNSRRWSMRTVSCSSVIAA